MGKIFRNMIPYWKSAIVIFALLVVQAWCDLSLPQYTSDIIDVGIQNGGVEHILPEAVTKEEYEMAEIFLSDKEKQEWERIYKENGKVFERKDLGEEELDEYDSLFCIPLILNYQMSAVEEDVFREQMAVQSGQDKSALDGMSIEEIGSMMGVELSVFEREVEDDSGEKVKQKCVDMRVIFQKLKEAGQLDETMISGMRESVQKMIDTMGESLVHSMGIAYAVSCDKQAGLDMDKVQTNYLWAEGGKMLGLTLLMAVATVFVSFFASRVGAGIGRDLRGRVFRNVTGFSNAEIDKFSTASLITRCTNDVQQIQMVSAVFLRMLAYAPILGIGGIIKVSKTGADMGWVIGLAVLVIVGFVMVLMSIAMPKFKIMQVLVDKVNLVSREILTGLSVIRAFGREKTEEERFDRANKELTKTMLFTNRVMTFMMPGMMFLMNGLTVLIVWIGAERIDDGTMQVGAMTAFITYAMMIVMSFLMLTMMSVMLPRAAVSAKRIDEVVRTETSILNKDNAIAINDTDKTKGVISFEHVSFCYPGAKRNVLENIDFTAEPGKATAIIGSTGCGKSTLIQLIPRMYDVTGGKITIDGVDIRDVRLEDLRELIGYVPQKGVLFSGTIESNLKFGNKEATEEEIKEAAEIAQAKTFIEEKKSAYHSSISQGGTNVSGGQKQRLAIARAIVKNPKIYIFDDSFSALDLKTDAALRRELAEKTKEATVFIVAQRISTILNAEQIIVLDEGRIAGIGTHEELLKNCEVYEQIAKSQMSAKELGLEVQ